MIKETKIDVKICQTNKMIIQEIWTIYPIQVQFFKNNHPRSHKNVDQLCNGNSNVFVLSLFFL